MSCGRDGLLTYDFFRFVSRPLITQAASLGHRTAIHLGHYLTNPTRPRLPPAELEAQLDAIEQRVVLSVLHETADPA